MKYIKIIVLYVLLSFPFSIYSQDIKLLNIQLTEIQKKYLMNRSSNILNIFNGLLDTNIGPSKVDLGMNGVPVLNQGPYPTCVTFAVTAAIDAALGWNDYISQTCSLQLNNYLKQYSYYGDDWRGALSGSLLPRMLTYGIMSKDNEHKIGCGGLKEYPALGNIPISFIDLPTYKKYSVSLNNLIFVKELLNFNSDEAQATNDAKILINVRNSLIKGNRVLIGFIVPPTRTNGLLGKFKVNNDSWIMSSSMLKYFFFNSENISAHEVIVIGYDDNAVAMDKEGVIHKGLLKIRNSWGKEAGDNGDFYMSYDFFKSTVLEAYEIGKRE